MNTEENKETMEQTEEQVTDIKEVADTPPTENSLLEELSRQTKNSKNTYTYISPSDEEKKTSNKKKLRLGLEIAGGVLLLIMIFSSSGKVSREEYDDMEAKFNSKSSKLAETTNSLRKTKAEYSSYKKKMSKFDNLTDEQVDALIAEVDKITAEKKAAEDAAAEAAAAEKAAAEDAAAQAAAEEEAKRQAAASATLEQKNALRKAKDYLAYSAFSYSGLIDQLKYEGFSDEASTYAVDNCGADWNEQAAKKAQAYMNYSSFSRAGLVDQLLYEGFSSEQAEYGVTAAGY